MEDGLDSLFSLLGTGSWNWLHFATIGYAVSMPVPHALAGAFVAPRLKHRCRLPRAVDNVIHFTNGSHWDSCNYFTQLPLEDTKKKACMEWDFDHSTFSTTLTSEFGLVCQWDYLRATYQSMYMIGVLLGAPLNGILADRYGRKFTFVVGCVLFSILANISCWLPNIPSLLMFRLLLGTMHTFLLKTGFILAVEISSPKVRSLVGVVLFLPWGVGTIIWGFLAYLVRDWRYLLMTASVPCLLLLPPLWFMDESPRWLVVRNEHERALVVLKKAAKWNKVTLPSDGEVLGILQRKGESPKESTKTQDHPTNAGWKTSLKNFAISIIILFRTPRLRLASLVMHFDFLVLGMVYFGLSLSGGNFNFNVFSYMALMGLVEVPAYTIMAPIVSRFGRKIPIAVFYLLSGTVLLIQPFIPSGIQWLVIGSAMVGKMAIAMSFQGCNLFASELFPTEVRTRGVSSSFMLSRVGSAIAPFITEYLGMLYPWGPAVVFGGASAVAGFATLALWETLGLALPDTIVQLESNDFKLDKRCITKVTDDQDKSDSTTTKL